MQAIRSFQDLTKDAAPSSWSRTASASMSIPALAKLGQHRLAVASVRSERRAGLAVVGKGLERALRHGVDGERCGEGVDIERVGGFGVLGAGAGPEKALGPGTGVGGALEARRGKQLAIGLVRTLGDGDTEPVGQLAWNLAADGHVPAADKERGDRGDGRVQPRLDAPLDAAQVGVRRRQVLLAREEQRHVDGNAGEDRRLDGGQALFGPGDLDEKVGLAASEVEIAGGRHGLGGIMGQQGRDLERDPSVHPVRALKGRAEQIRGPREIGQRQLEEQVLPRCRPTALSERCPRRSRRCS